MSARLALLISGRGSNMLAIARACEQRELNARVVGVLANRGDAEGLSAAREQGLDTVVVEHRNYDSRHDFDAALNQQLVHLRPDWVVLAGFMRILGADFINQWRGRMINIHPSLLPAYPGLDTHARVLANGDAVHGATVHFVTPELDAGPIIAQVQVPVRPDDTGQTLAARVLEQEHALYVRALALCLSGQARMGDRPDSAMPLAAAVPSSTDPSSTDQTGGQASSWH